MPRHRLCFLLTVLGLACAAAAQETAPLDFRDTELLCIQEGGRKKPLHTFAVESIEQIVGRPLFAGTPYWRNDKTGERLDALDAFLAIWLKPGHEADQPLILVAYGPLKKALDLPVAEKHFAFTQLAQSATLQELRQAAHALREEGREKDLPDLLKEVEIVDARVRLVEMIQNGNATLALVPHPSKENGTWLTLDGVDRPESASWKPPYSAQQCQDVRDRFENFRTAYLDHDAAKFAVASRDFHSALALLSPSVYPSIERLDREVRYNQARPFGRAWLFYLGAALAALFALRFPQKWLYAAAWVLYAGGLAFHLYGFVLRCLIAGRPPVANMYESVVWAGFGAVLFGLIFELRSRRRYFLLSGAVAGACCLMLMDLLPVVLGNSEAPGFEAQIRPLMPVLRDNFWLSVHVLTIVLSYAAFMLAWVLGHITLGKHLFNPGAKADQDELNQFVYRVLQVGVLLLACGTILGGVWAYYSWGRFWGWDPKETWAFIALLCYLVVLHGRHAKWWGHFGVSVGAVVCFLAVVMAWYGVNFVLGSGMHAYGSGTGGLGTVVALVAVDLIFTVAAVAKHGKGSAA